MTSKSKCIYSILAISVIVPLIAGLAESLHIAYFADYFLLAAITGSFAYLLINKIHIESFFEEYADEIDANRYRKEEFYWLNDIEIYKELCDKLGKGRFVYSQMGYYSKRICMDSFVASKIMKSGR